MRSLFSSEQDSSRLGSNKEGAGRWPWFVQLGGAVLGICLLLGMQADPREGASSPAVTVASTGGHVLPPDGEQIYNTRCMSCHQMSGKGVPGTFPPLAGTDWVTGDKGRLIRLLLNGLSGSIKVDGQTYSGVMPPWGSALSDEQIAGVATYIRTNFGNEASKVTVEEVAKVRAATKGRSKPWTAKELKKAANQGIPGDSTSTEG